MAALRYLAPKFLEEERLCWLRSPLYIVKNGKNESYYFTDEEFNKAKVKGEVGYEQIYREERSLDSKYINIPINLRYGIGLGSVASLNFFAGPQFGFNVGKKHQELVDDATWNLKSSAFSVNVGAGVTIASHFELYANYNIACGRTGDVTFSDAVDKVFKKNGRANAWQIGLAYYF